MLIFISQTTTHHQCPTRSVPPAQGRQLGNQAEACELRPLPAHTCSFSNVMPVHPGRDGALHCNSNQISHSPARRPASGTEIERRQQLPVPRVSLPGRLGRKTRGCRKERTIGTRLRPHRHGHPVVVCCCLLLLSLHVSMFRR